MTHLWDVKHPYYCSESNFYSRDCYCMHASWQDFTETMGQSDGEYNLLFRWDWRAPEDFEWQGNEHCRDCILKLFFVMQRKGIFACHEVAVCRADESKVKDWLQDRMKHIVALWEPLKWGSSQ